MSALLEVDGAEQALRRRAGGRDLSFTVGEGEILGLIGPNGAGKSTVFNLINGVFAPNAGRIVFHGRDITGERPTAWRAPGSRAPTRSCSRFRISTVLENCTVGACFGRDNLPLARGRARSRARSPCSVGLEDRLGDAGRRSSPSPARSGSSSRARSPPGRFSCCSTRCWPASTRPRSSA